MLPPFIELQNAIEKIKAINESEPVGTVSDYVEQLAQKETDAQTVADITYKTYEFATKAKANRTSAQRLINSLETGSIKKDELLQKVHSLNQSEPQRSVSDIFDEMLTKHFDWKKTEDPKVFKGIVSKSVVERQILQYEDYLFLEKYPPKADSWENLLIKREEMDLVLRDDKETISPQVRQMLESFVEVSKKTTNEKIAAEQRKKQAGKREQRAQKRRFLLDIIAWAARV